MALPSQSSGAGSGRRYMVSRRRRRARWPWIAAALLIGVCWLYIIFSGESDSSAQTTGDLATASAQSTDVSRSSAPPTAQNTPAPPPRTPATTSRPRSATRNQPRNVEPPSIDATKQTAAASRSKPAKVQPRSKLKPPAQDEHSKIDRPNPTIELSRGVAESRHLIDQGKFLEARQALNDLLHRNPQDLNDAEANVIRRDLAQINDVLVFSKRIVKGDALADTYTVKQGDYLIKIAKPYKIAHQFIEHVNQVQARRIRPGQRLKLVRGPFHAVVDKSEFRLDVYLQSPGTQGTYIRSFPVGLGEDDSTPLGEWVVRPNSKVTNPEWVDPRQGTIYARDDPKNPIGEHWIGLQGTDEQNRDLSAYGIHGTIAPESIGQSASMGCLRMLPDDVALLYAMLKEGESRIRIIP